VSRTAFYAFSPALMIVAFLAHPTGRSHSLFTRLPLFKITFPTKALTFITDI